MQKPIARARQAVTIMLTITLPMLGLLPAAEQAAKPNGTIQISWDNDAFNSSDDHYTNGLQIGYVSGYLDAYDQPHSPAPGFLGRWLTYLPLVNREGRQRFVSYSLSHRIFTPNDIADPDLIEDDLPYSAMLFGTLTAGAQDAQAMDAWSLTLGVVGPAALGEEIQSSVHDLIDSQDPKGWEHQLENELLINLWYEHRRRVFAIGNRRGFSADSIVQVGGAIGNLIGMATAGIGLRFGWHLPDDYGAPPQFFGEETVGSRPWSTSFKSSLMGFVHVNGSVFSNAIFWDGNTFEDSHSIDYDPYIGRIYAGIRAHYGAWSGSFSFAVTSVPWENPDDRTSQRYGRIAITYTW